MPLSPPEPPEPPEPPAAPTEPTEPTEPAEPTGPAAPAAPPAAAPAAFAPPPGPWGPQPPHTVWAVPNPMPGMPGIPGSMPGSIPDNRTSGQAITAFVTGLFAVVPVSVVFGIVALVRIRRTRRRGKSLAIAGLVLSGGWLVLGLFGLLFGATYASMHATTVGTATGERPLQMLPIGTCYDQPSSEVTDFVPVVPCDQPHDRQLYAVLRSPTADAGTGADQQWSQAACVRALSTAFPDPAGVLDAAYVDTYYPDPSSFQEGEPLTSCALSARDSGQQLTGSLPEPGGTSGPLQQRYLRLTLQATLLRVEVADSIPGQWQSALPLAAALARADRAEAKVLESAPLGGGSMAEDTAALAQDDLAEAAQADRLASVTSSAQWSATLVDLQPPLWLQDVDTLRSALNLNTA
ncbi:DUF4190 domain-containing protein [Streptacidiphilus sp. P02-A3a]|uniref:DUF4190 domain-containing protein n=1 Tax=Streptacidiphilus sp. P02-A3a TaxID=2704468 RepID=UPI0015FCF7B6|nr:DUF4190 domain-containing protein [Streptacidiphilus sp. P02-A3a]QMU67481.1 DUF4190 domain-containing protein [Streptacidiphilus sp. P02-A3a]